MQSVYDRMEAIKDNTTVELSISYLECVYLPFNHAKFMISHSFTLQNLQRNH